MLESQIKNTIKIIVAVLLVTILGEGVFSVGLYWPFLILLLEWDGVFWLAFAVGILVSVLNGLTVGLASLLLVIIMGMLSLFFGSRRDAPLILVICLLLANLIFDRLLGIKSSLLESVLLAGVCVLVLGWGGNNESIHIKYK